jgi:hypothetical protein
LWAAESLKLSLLDPTLAIAVWAVDRDAACAFLQNTYAHASRCVCAFNLGVNIDQLFALAKKLKVLLSKASVLI